MAQRQVGFDDERRRSSYSTPTFLQADTYRPGELRERGDRDNRDRGRGRDIDHDWRDEDSRDHRSDYRSPERRDGRQSDTTRDSNPKSKHLHSLETDASMLNAPLRPRDSASSSINRSPVVGRFGPTPSTHAPTKSTYHPTPSTSAASSPSLAGIPTPKAKDPMMQEILDAHLKLINEQLWQTMIGADRNKRKKEIEKRSCEAKKFLADPAAFPQQRILLQKAKDRDALEFNKIDTKYKQINKSVQERAETLSNAIYNAISRQAPTTEPLVPVFSDPAPSIAALERQITSLRSETHTDIHKLQADSNAAEGKIDRLHAVLQSERAKYEETSRKVTALESQCQLNNAKIEELEALAKEYSRQDAERKEELADTKKRLKKQDAEKMKLKEDIISLQKRMTAFKDDTDQKTMRDEIKKVEQSYKAASAELKADVKEALDSHQAALAQLDGRTASTADLCKINVKTERLFAECSQTTKTLTDVDRRLSDQERKLQQQNNLSASVQNFDNRLFKTSQQVLDLRERLGELDIVGLQHVLDQWALHDIDRLVESMQEDPRRTSQASIPPPISVQADINPINAHLRKEIEELQLSLQRLRQDVSSLSDASAGVEARLKVDVEATIAESNDLIGGAMDHLNFRVCEANTRIDNLEAKGVQARTPAPTPRLDSRASPVRIDANLTARVQAIENQKLGHKLQDLAEKLAASDTSHSSKQGANESELERIRNSLHDHATAYEGLFDQVRGQLDQQELQLQNLDSGISNMNTHAMAQTILRGLDSYTSRVGPKFDMTDNRLVGIEQQLRGMQSWIDTTGAMFHIQANKRAASPRAHADADKRRRLGINGGHVTTSSTASAPAAQPGPSAPRSYQ